MDLNNLDLNKLAVFSKVVEAGNYRLASEALHVTPSALSQTISSLEHSLGFPLFHRLGKRLVLTETGAAIQREFARAQADFVGALARIAREDAQVSGMIRIGAYLEFAKFRLAPVLCAFQRRHPEVQVKFTFDTPSRLHRLLEANQLDVCFSIFPERERQLIRSQPIYREELVLVAPVGLLRTRPTLDEVLAAPMIEYYLNHQPIRRWLMLHFKRRPKRLPIRTLAATAEMVLRLAEEGLGMGVIPAYLLPTRGRRAVEICRPTPRRLLDHVWMLQLRGRAPSPALDAFTAAAQGLGSPP